MNIFAKILGSVLILTSSTMLGFRHAAEITEQRATAETMIRYWKSFRQLLQTTHCSAAGIAVQLGRSIGFREFPFAMKLCCNSQKEAPFELILQQTMRDCAELSPELKNTLLPIGESLGKASLETQLQVIDAALLMMQQELDLRLEQEKREGMLFRRLGILGGIALVVLLL